MRRRHSPRLAVVAAAFAVGCAHRVPAVGAPDHPASTLLIRVENNHTRDVTVFAVHAGVRRRLGEVASGLSHVWKVSTREIAPTGQFQLEADPVGAARGFLSQPVHAMPGQIVEWSLEGNLARSTLMVRNP
jgi:type IV pilus biogenesis protein CpaD/CtpE